MVQRLVSVGDDFTLPTPVKVANANLPAHVQPAALTATIGDKISTDALPRGGTVLWNNPAPLVNIYPSGAGAGMHFASQTGFNGPYLVGYGVDHAGVVGFELSIKANGTGISLAQWPAAGVGIAASNRSANPLLAADLYAGLGSGMQFALKSGAHFADGVLTAGSTTFTSAAAAFVAGDVGKTLSTTWPYPDDLPTGTVISAVTNGTTVTLSKAAVTSRTGASFLVAGRVNPDTQRLISFYDTDGTSPIFQVRKASAVIAVPINARDAGSTALRIQAAAGQTNDIQSWRDSNTNRLSRVNKDGRIMSNRNTTPAAGDLDIGEWTFHGDATAGAEKIYLSMKNASGALVTKQVTFV